MAVSGKNESASRRGANRSPKARRATPNGGPAFSPASRTWQELHVVPDRLLSSVSVGHRSSRLIRLGCFRASAVAKTRSAFSGESPLPSGPSVLAVALLRSSSVWSGWLFHQLPLAAPWPYPPPS